MAEEEEASRDRLAVTEPSNHPASQPTPTTTNNESASASTHSPVPSKSPRQNSVPPLEPSPKPPIPESQAMTTSSSSSSLPPEPQPETTGPSPYGTRSRNRTGNARINYAEDREVDADYEWTSSKKPQGNSGSAASAALPPGDSDKVSAGNTRRSSATALNGLVPNNKGAFPTPQNTDLPGMSTFSAYPDPHAASAVPASTRKRKTPGTGHAASHTTALTAQSAALGSSKRNSASLLARGIKANLMTFESCQGYLTNGTLQSDDGTVLAVNDQVYLVCEPPGEPYYLARIMEFLHVDNNPNAPVDSLRVNWFLRSRDIGRKVNDTRAVFASMQSDTSPITSLRGKCKILHRTDIGDLDLYRKEPNSFWYEKLYDRYIHRFYEVIPTSQVINVPAKVKKVLDERWRFVVLEVGRGRELTSAIKSCKRCQGFCASNDSVDCAVCKNTYHMNCVRPPLLKKPARGFGWSCGPCSRKQEKKLEARNTPIVGEKSIEGEEEEFVDEEEDQSANAAGNGSSSRENEVQNPGARPPTAEQIAQAKLWPFRYLGIHCRVEDALDYDDRIYPRASSRLGPKHQATVQPWYGHHVEYAKPTDVKRRVLKATSHKKDAKTIKDTTATHDASKIAREKRPKWVMDEPHGFVTRGDDYRNNDNRNTARLSFRMPEVGEASSRGEDPSDAMDSERREKLIDDYMTRAKALAPLFDLKEYSTNFLDKALELLVANNYQIEKALQQLKNVNKTRDLKEPELTKEELKRFEEGVRRYGSELRLVSKHVGKTRKHGEIVRFYYMWKKTPEGKKIWGNYEGRKGKKQQKQADTKLVDDVADDVDDSAFDTGKGATRRRGFECKFCAIRHSTQWRRAPATATGATVPIDPSMKNNKDKNAHLILALCYRCAYLWRCYAITWENPDEVAKKVASGGGRAWKRRIDEELLAELTTASVASSVGVSTTAAAAAASVGVDVPSNLTMQSGQDLPRKKQRLAADVPSASLSQNALPIEAPKRKLVEKPPEPPLVPEPPKIRILPCAVCYEFVAGEEMNDEYLCCTRCRLTVHRNCYGVADGRPKDKWVCDPCANDSAPHTIQASTNYYCCLCPVEEYPDKELMEAPKSHHKKKNDREKEKERLERELVVNATENYYRTQREKGRPEQPRQPLKKTYFGYWVHVVCAVFHFEVKFARPKELEFAEGTGAIGYDRFKMKCKLCKTDIGACVSCKQCGATFHASCAQQHGYQLGFELGPIKGSRKMAEWVTMNGEEGTGTAVIYCKEHAKPVYNQEEKKGLHSMAEFYADPDDPTSRINSLQTFVRVHKSACVRDVGTLHRSAMLDTATQRATQVDSGSTHRGSVSSVANERPFTSVYKRTRPVKKVYKVKSDNINQDSDRVIQLEDATSKEPQSKDCLDCGTTVSPKWHPASGTPYTAPPRPEEICTEKSTSDPKNIRFTSLNGTEIFKIKPMETPSLGGFGLDGTTDTNGTTTMAASSFDPLTNGERSGLDLGRTDDGEEHRRYICNKCFHRRRKAPTPPRMPTPPPDPVIPAATTGEAVEDVVDVPMEAPVSTEVDPPSPPAPLAWPSQVAQTVPQEAYQVRSSQPATLSPSVPPIAPPAAPYIGPERLSNGVSPRSPPIVAPPPPHHYPPPPPSQSHHHPASFIAPPQNYRDSRGVMHRGLPPQYHVAHLINGVPAEPPSFQYRRDSSGNLYQVPYVPPSLRPQTQATTSLRSPPMVERSSQGPHGPPEAAENPFAVPAASHSPPRPSFSGIYGSPTGSHERPETPPGPFVRDSRWPGEGALVNGASASPSLRNLLQ